MLECTIGERRKGVNKKKGRVPSSLLRLEKKNSPLQKKKLLLERGGSQPDNISFSYL
jgi:hypothetical protein